MSNFYLRDPENFILAILKITTGGQEVKFHEIKTGDGKFLDPQVDKFFSFFMRSKVAIKSFNRI
jgi:hypothetical protein